MRQDYKEQLSANSFPHPVFNRLAQLAQASLEEVVAAFDDHQLLRLWQGCNQGFQFGARAELVARSTHEQLGLEAVAQKIESINAGLFRVGSDRRNGNSYANHSANSRVGTSRSQSNRRAKRKSREDQRQMKFGIEPVKRSAHVFDLALALVVFALAQARAAKVEAQHRETKAVQRLHSVEDNFIVQRPAKQRMRMADDGCKSGILGATVKQRFQPSHRAVKE